MAKRKNIDIKSKHSDYASLIKEITLLLESSRRISVRAVNVLMTATYWVIGYKIIEYE